MDSGREAQVPILAQIDPSHYRGLAKVAARHGQTRIVLDHLGGAGLLAGDAGSLQQLMELSRYRNIYVKASHLYGLDRTEEEEACIPQVLEQLRAAFGADHLLFGSNWPLVRSFSGLKRCVEGFCHAVAGFSAEERALILSGTAEQLYEWLQEDI